MRDIPEQAVWATALLLVGGLSPTLPARADEAVLRDGPRMFSNSARVRPGRTFLTTSASIFWRGVMSPSTYSVE